MSEPDLVPALTAPSNDVAETVPEDHYNSIFSFNVVTPEVQVDTRLWENIVENVPEQYSIPDPEFIQTLSQQTSSPGEGPLKHVADE
ncbi:hypothetical protein [Gordoniibacillus kamchatkensis]|nr:hypothetical protein [Paenibacillus sp. VKM B-2647]